MKRTKKIVALALAAAMMISTASTAFAAKNAQTDTVPGTVKSYETINIPMIKVDGKWKIDPLFAFIGIKNIKWNSEISDLSLKNNPKKLTVNTKSKYAPYALLLEQKGTIVPANEPLKTKSEVVRFWVKGPRQATLYTYHEVTLYYIKRESPLTQLRIGSTEYDVKEFDTSNSAKLYKKANWGWRSLRVRLQDYYKNLKLVAIGKDGHNYVIRSTKGNVITTASVNFKNIKAIQIRYSVDRAATNKKGCIYYNYLKDGVKVPGDGCLTINIK